MDNQNGAQQSCIDVRYVHNNKTQTGAVCIALSKNVGRKERKIDLIFMPEETNSRDMGTFSMRSTTELMNVLAHWKVSFEERKRVFEFVAERLRTLVGEETAT
ncbi:MAG TPA: hypothetical protein VEF35_09255 [Candidatus Bathyarchaeia archaeon]|nr:hypothetical protein [Candidatus Bathyarchaeia archaeon]